MTSQIETDSCGYIVRGVDPILMAPMFSPVNILSYLEFDNDPTKYHH